MARPRNNEVHEQIEREARTLFLEKGYKNTSYADIAAACGLAKTNVQQHFPKKELFISDLYQDLLDELDTFLTEHKERTDNYFVNLYRIGQLLFGFLLGTEELRRFTFDLLSDRNLTDIMIDLEVAWATSYEVGFTKDELATFGDDIAMIMGGIYELIYRNLKVGVAMHPEDIQTRIMTMFAYTRGLSAEEAAKLFPRGLVSAEEFADANTYLQQKLFQ